MKSQMYFSDKALKFQSSEFPDIVSSFCEGREKLQLVEEGQEDVDFEKSKFFFAQEMIASRHLLKLLISVLKTSKNYRLAATIGADPKTKIVKFHLRYQWNHSEDQEFQVNVLKGDFQPIGPEKPTWMPTSRGIALNLDDLKEFLEADICGLLLNTIVKKEVKKWVQEVVLYICNQN